MSGHRHSRRRADRACRPGAPSPSGSARLAQRALCARDARSSNRGSQDGRYDAIVTAPVQKSVINDADVPFSGHTEYLAERTGTARVVMMLAGDTRTDRFASHSPPRICRLRRSQRGADASTAVTAVLNILDRGPASPLRHRYGRASWSPGLNPHAGESGHIGREEIELIAPAIRACAARVIDVDGPLPADTVFVPSLVQRYDAVLAMFHDQGLPVLKYATFGHGVNMTLGLPFVRTSVDHGTALDLRGHRPCRRRQHAGRAEACNRTRTPRNPSAAGSMSDERRADPAREPHG